MSEIQPVLSNLWWLPYATLILAAASIMAGLVCAYRAWVIWHYRDNPPTDPVVAKLLEEVTPPPYGIYAALWLAAGVILAGWTFAQ